jgi:hypothetical protein
MRFWQRDHSSRQADILGADPGTPKASNERAFRTEYFATMHLRKGRCAGDPPSAQKRYLNSGVD